MGSNPGYLLKSFQLKKEKSVKMDILDNSNSGYRPKSLVKLNVGGKMFMTTQGTLLSNQNLIQSKMTFPDEIGKNQFDFGACFIDRCPKYFGIILNFLRSGLLEKGENIDLNFLRNEAKFFCIESLVEVVDEEIKTQVGKNLESDCEQNSPNCQKCAEQDFAKQDYASRDYVRKDSGVGSLYFCERDVIGHDFAGQGEWMKEKAVANVWFMSFGQSIECRI